MPVVTGRLGQKFGKTAEVFIKFEGCLSVFDWSSCFIVFRIQIIEVLAKFN